MGSEMCIRDRVKEIERLSIGLCSRSFKSNLRYTSNWWYGEMISTLEFEYSDLSFNLNRFKYLVKLSQHLQGKFSKTKKILKNDFQVVRC